MCGIAGIISQKLNQEQLAAALESVRDCIAQRGPDDVGSWYDHANGIALGHRRLAILDLSPEGHQPMLSPSKRFAIVFNGEIYNFQDLRRDLQAKGYKFRGGSDTEVMLAAFEAWGIEESTKKFNGMFAYALWDSRDKKFYLGRDRLGVKPLYYGWVPGGFVFSSQVKSFECSPGFAGQIDRNAVCLYMRHNYIPSPYSIYEGVYKLPQATILSLSLEQLAQEPAEFSPDYLNTSARLRPQPFWSAREIAERGQRNLKPDSEQTLAELHTLLLDAVKLRMISDVPLGAFLSGGLDSSTVVALMQAQSSLPVKTYSIGFREGQYNEAAHAKAVAEHLKTDHTEMYVTPQDALDVIPRLPAIFDEPFSDSSQIPTYLLSKLTRQHVTVSLSGDGGDELFSGYTRYLWAQKVKKVIGSIPSPVRRGGAAAIRTMSREQWDRVFTTAAPLLPRKLRISLPGDKMHKLARVLNYSNVQDVYTQMVSHWDDPAQVVIGGAEPPVGSFDARTHPELENYISRMMYFDLMNYLPDDVMVKVDRASMASSLEAREPLLDYRLVEFAWQLPLEMKMRGTESKWALRQILYKYVPKELVERPKMGFGVPIDSWLRGPLREWAGDLLSESALRKFGILNPQPIRVKWQQHLDGKHNWQYHLWDALMLQSWLQERSH